MKASQTLAVALCCIGLLSLPADAKKWTIYERQVKLSGEIDAGQKSGDLTAKECESLKKEASKITEDIAVRKAKNAGKLSVDDENDIEKKLNKLSLKIQKEKLEKRVQ